MIWRMFIVLALLLVAGLTLYFGGRGANTDTPEATREPPQPGYFMTDAEITEMGPDGHPRYRVSAARIVQDPQALSVHLDDMKLVYRAEGADEGERGREWTLTADTGLVPPGARTIDLKGNVEVNGLPMRGAVPAVMRTERLHLDTETNVATTGDRVDIIWGRRSLSSMGLKADLKAQTLQLESAVHGRFVP